MTYRHPSSDQFAHAENSGISLLVQLLLVAILALTYISVYGTTYEPRGDNESIIVPCVVPSLQPLDK